MINKFTPIKPNELTENAIQLIGFEWFLLTVGKSHEYNTMTAAWGNLGYLWNKPVATVYVRPQRFTYEFIEKEEFFTIQFFDAKYKDILKYCGSHSGREVDKIAETGLTAFDSPHGNVYFEQAKIQMECRKIYSDDIKAELFTDKAFLKNYPKNDFHRFYVGEIVDCIQS